MEILTLTFVFLNALLISVLVTLNRNNVSNISLMDSQDVLLIFLLKITPGSAFKSVHLKLTILALIPTETFQHGNA